MLTLHGGPDLRHSIVAARWARRAICSAALHPGMWAGGCWVLVQLLKSGAKMSMLQSPTSQDVKAVCDTSSLAPKCYVAHHGDTVATFAYAPNAGSPADTFLYTAGLVSMIGVALAVTAVFLGIFSLFTTPTHRVGRDGRLHTAGRGLSRPTLATRAANRGAFTRIKGTKAGMVADWKAAGRTKTKLDRRLARFGRWRLTRWGRRWAREDAVGAERTNPRFYDRWAIRHAEPPKTERGKRKAEERHTKKADRKASRKAEPAPYPDDTLPPPPPKQKASTAKGPRLDPTNGPKQAPPRPEPTERERVASETADQFAGRY